jgi:hypothetical protein
VVAEPAGQAQPVFGDLGALSLVIGDTLGDGAAVPGPDAGEVGVAEAALASAAGGGGPGVGVDEHVSHGDRAQTWPSGPKRYSPARSRSPWAAHRACNALVRCSYPL